MRDRRTRLAGQSFDGHTLAAQIAQTEHITGVPVARAYVNRGYRGHDADKDSVLISVQKRGVTPTMRRKIRPRAGIEPVIGHLKQHGFLGRNFVTGPAATPPTSSSPPPATTSVSSAPG